MPGSLSWSISYALALWCEFDWKFLSCPCPFSGLSLDSPLNTQENDSRLCPDLYLDWIWTRWKTDFSLDRVWTKYMNQLWNQSRLCPDHRLVPDRNLDTNNPDVWTKSGLVLMMNTSATDHPFLTLPILTLTGSKDFIERAQIIRINDLQLSTSPSFQVEWIEKNNIRMARYIIYDIFYYIYRMQNTMYYIQYHNRVKKYGIWYTVYHSNS